MLAMVPPDPFCTIRTKIETNDVHVTSLAKCSRRYGANKKTINIVHTVLEVEIGPKVTALGIHRTLCHRIIFWWRRHEGGHQQHK